ncbi:MAG: hypothetical protein QOI81_1129 [Actinomycetota bacterium]|jgi:predicted  nucleic acid-binding Zn-ribbon protein|nr:hypothetical protein [Actinomycetota bacterium]
MASKPLNDKARDTLARELYWAQERAENSNLTTSQVRDRLRELATQVRADENVVIPFGETNLISAGRGRRQLKYLLYRVARPVTWRYDRLTAEQAELTKALADRLLAVEAELEDLRQLLVQKDNSLGGGGPSA